MTTGQAEEILKHTFKQLEKMLNEEARKGKSVSEKPHKPRNDRKSADESTISISEKK